MIRPGPWRAPATDRQREVVRVLAEESLAGALERLGPVFTRFGLYLATRPDLLAAGDCLELAGLPDRAEPLPAAAILDLLGAEWGRPATEILAGFDERPRQSRLLVQEHRARLVGGEAVVVRVLRPGLELEAGRDLPLLGSVPGVPAEAAADFREAWSVDLDFASQAAGLEALAQDAGDSGVLRVPRVHRGLSTSRVLFFEDLGGVPLDEWSGPGDPVRRLCLAWLRQALQGRAVPVEPRDACAEVLPGDRLVFTGPMTRIPLASQANVWSYLMAAVRRDPDEVCDRLLREMTREEPAASEERLRLRLRQAVPFRDGGWNLVGESLAEHLFLHWRYARECGFRPRVPLLAFWRGLAAVAETARRLAPERDALLQGLEELRFTSSFDQVREMLGADQIAESFERYAVLMSRLPERLDEALTAAAEGGRRRGGGVPDRADKRRGSPLPLAAVLLALAAAALLARQLGGAWDGRAGAILFFGAGTFLLWWMGRA